MADRSDLAPSAMANLLIFCGSTPEKQRTLLITMIQEIQRPVKCQKLNKFTSRNRKLSVKQAKDQSLACSGLCRPLRSNVVGNRTVPYLAGSMKVLWGLPRSCPPQARFPPTNAPCPTATNRLTPAAAAGIPVRFAHSNVVGTYGSPTNAPSLTGSTWVFWEMVFVFRKGFPGFPICRGYDKISAGAVRALVFIHKV